MQSGAHVVYVFFLYFVPYISTLSSNKQHRAQTPLSSIWNKKSAPRARHEKKPIQNRAGHKSLAHVDRDRRLLGAEQQHRQTDRQAACPPRLSLIKSQILVRSTVRHIETDLEKLLHAVLMSSSSSPFSISFIQFQLCFSRAVTELNSQAGAR